MSKVLVMTVVVIIYMGKLSMNNDLELLEHAIKIVEKHLGKDCDKLK